MKKFIIASALALVFSGLNAMDTRETKRLKRDESYLSSLPTELQLHITDFLINNEKEDFEKESFQKLNKVNKKFKDIADKALIKQLLKSDKAVDLLKLKKWYSENEQLRNFLDINQKTVIFLNQLQDNIGTLAALNMAIFMDQIKKDSGKAAMWIMNHFSNIPIRSIMTWIKEYNIVSDDLNNDIKRQRKFKKMLYLLKLKNNTPLTPLIQHKINFLEKIGVKLSSDEEAQIQQIKAARAANRVTSRLLF